VEDLYTSAEARNKLNASTSTFKRLVDTGKIRKVTPPNKKQGMYIKEDVEKIAEEMKPFVQNTRRKGQPGRKKKELSTTVDWQKISDLPAILKLDLVVYHEQIVGDIGLYISWERKNPKITLISFESGKRENILAYLSLVPLPEQIILSILKEEREELSISQDEIESYDRKGGYTLLAESAVTHPDHPEQLNHVLREALRFWCDQYPDRYIEKIYAQAATDDGDILIRRLYFSPLYNLADNAYVLDLKRPGIAKPVRIFQECLQQKKANQSDKLSFLKEREASDFRKAIKRDIPSCVELSKKTFPDLYQGIASAETRIAWMNKNPDICYVSTYQGKIVGYTTILPLERDKIEKVLRNEEFVKDIKAEEIKPFDAKTSTDIYIMTMVTDPNLSRTQKRTFGSSMVRGLENAIIDLGKRGVHFKNIFARSDTPDGVRILRKMGFMEIPSVTNLRNFVINIEESGVPMIQEYKEALASH